MLGVQPLQGHKVGGEFSPNFAVTGECSPAGQLRAAEWLLSGALKSLGYRSWWSSSAHCSMWPQP